MVCAAAPSVALMAAALPRWPPPLKYLETLLSALLLLRFCHENSVQSPMCVAALGDHVLRKAGGIAAPCTHKPLFAMISPMLR